jgi:hypothetical protein
MSAAGRGKGRRGGGSCLNFPCTQKGTGSLAPFSSAGAQPDLKPELGSFLLIGRLSCWWRAFIKMGFNDFPRVCN